jgi:hypothetical protein
MKKSLIIPAGLFALLVGLSACKKEPGFHKKRIHHSESVNLISDSTDRKVILTGINVAPPHKRSDSLRDQQRVKKMD